MRAIDVVRRFAPQARPQYLEAFEAHDHLLQAAEVDSAFRLAAFLGQAMVETGAFTILRESGAYRAERILEIFGVGHHSARVTPAEAARLAGDGPALFERVYGLGNPKKATELGNTQAGDGWTFRGNGILQTTGRGNHRRMGQKCGVDFEARPELVTAAEHALKPALAEWSEGNLNLLADDGSDTALTRISRRINGGDNGLADRLMWTKKIRPSIVALTFAPAPAQAAIAAAPVVAAVPVTRAAVERLQTALRAGGADPGAIDGLIGPQTIRAFQTAQKLPVTGQADVETQSRLAEALASFA